MFVFFHPKSETADRVMIKYFPHDWTTAHSGKHRPTSDVGSCPRATAVSRSIRGPNESRNQKWQGRSCRRRGSCGILAKSHVHLDLRLLALVFRAKLCDRCSPDLEADRNPFISIYVFHAWISFPLHSESPCGAVRESLRPTCRSSAFSNKQE